MKASIQTPFFACALALGVTISFWACSATSDGHEAPQESGDSNPTTSAGGTTTSPPIGSDDLDVGHPPDPSAGRASNPGTPPPFDLDDFTPAFKGGHLLGEPYTDDTVGDGDFCGNTQVLRGIVRDFKRYRPSPSDGIPSTGHPDFDANLGVNEVRTGIVAAQIGDDQKPVFQSGQGVVASQKSFDQWYRNVDGDVETANRAYILYLRFEKDEEQDGVFTYQTSPPGAVNFFLPLGSCEESQEENGGMLCEACTAGFGCEHSHRNEVPKERNYNFTVEIHTKFRYSKGQVFTFNGDDDMWIFIDGKLAVDLGGPHSPAEGTAQIDTLGLTEGEIYSLDIFHAERQNSGSNFRMDTNIQFTDCGSLPPVVR